jgi:hypothetical protein
MLLRATCDRVSPLEAAIADLREIKAPAASAIRHTEIHASGPLLEHACRRLGFIDDGDLLDWLATLPLPAVQKAIATFAAKQEAGSLPPMPASATSPVSPATASTRPSGSSSKPSSSTSSSVPTASCSLTSSIEPPPSPRSISLPASSRSLTSTAVPRSPWPRSSGAAISSAPPSRFQPLASLAPLHPLQAHPTPLGRDTQVRRFYAASHTWIRDLIELACRLPGSDNDREVFRRRNFVLRHGGREILASPSESRRLEGSREDFDLVAELFPDRTPVDWEVLEATGGAGISEHLSLRLFRTPHVFQSRALVDYRQEALEELQGEPSDRRRDLLARFFARLADDGKLRDADIAALRGHLVVPGCVPRTGERVHVVLEDLAPAGSSPSELIDAMPILDESQIAPEVSNALRSWLPTAPSAAAVAAAFGRLSAPSPQTISWLAKYVADSKRSRKPMPEDLRASVRLKVEGATRYQPAHELVVHAFSDRFRRAALRELFPDIASVDLGHYEEALTREDIETLLVDHLSCKRTFRPAAGDLGLAAARIASDDQPRLTRLSPPPRRPCAATRCPVSPSRIAYSTITSRSRSVVTSPGFVRCRTATSPGDRPGTRPSTTSFISRAPRNGTARSCIFAPPAACCP